MQVTGLSIAALYFVALVLLWLWYFSTKISEKPEIISQKKEMSIIFFYFELLMQIAA